MNKLITIALTILAILTLCLVVNSIARIDELRPMSGYIVEVEE